MEKSVCSLVTKKKKKNLSLVAAKERYDFLGIICLNKIHFHQ